ncbi:MAG: adenylate kinase family protein [Planctomycetota bacterium]
MGLKAKYFVDSGKFVPDAITNALFEAAFAANDYKGLVLDGYPRTVEQSQFLLELVKAQDTSIDFIVLVEGEDEEIVKRTVGRRICTSCSSVFHMEYKLPKDGKSCTDCGAEVILRSDDSEGKIRSRLQEFHSKAMPALEYLKTHGIPVVSVPGNLPVFTEEAVRESVMKALDLLDLSRC